MKNIKKYAIIAIFLAILISPNVSSADTIADLQAQISALLAQIQNLQQQLAQLQGQPATWCHDFNTNLTIGSSGSEVEALRTALEKEGFKIGSGNFDESMASLVSGFQQKYKDEVLAPWNLQYGTGFAGSTTRAKLNKLYGCGVKPPCPQYSFPLCKTGEQIVCPTVTGSGCPGPCMCKSSADCAQVMTPARNSETGECKDFPTPCDVPSGWIKLNIGSCSSISTPSITVLSPNGGEQFMQGSNQVIKWNAPDTIKYVYIQAVLDTSNITCPFGPCMPNPYIDIATSTPNTGSFSWHIDLTPQRYKILVKDPISHAFDESDAMFSIMNSSYNCHRCSTYYKYAWADFTALSDANCIAGAGAAPGTVVAYSKDCSCTAGANTYNATWNSECSISALEQPASLSQMASALESAKSLLYQLLQTLKNL